MQENNKMFWFVGAIIALVLIGIIAYVVMKKPAEEPLTPAEETSETTSDRKAASTNEIITLYVPQANERIGTPLLVQGELARPYTAVYFRLSKADGSILAEGYANVTHQTGKAVAPFRGELVYASQSGGQGTLTLFTKRSDGTEENTLVVPVYYTATPEFIKG